MCDQREFASGVPWELVEARDMQSQGVVELQLRTAARTPTHGSDDDHSRGAYYKATPLEHRTHFRSSRLPSAKRCHC